MAEYYLMHAGVSKLDGAPGRGSGRYPLGSGDRPYQDYPSKAASAKKSKRQMRKEKKAMAKKSAKQPKKEIEENPEDKRALSPERKAEVMHNADIKTAVKHMSEFSNSEIDDILLRNTKQKNLMAELPKHRTAQDKLKDVTSKINTAQEFTASLVKVYNTSAPVLNAFFKMKLPKIAFSDSTGQEQGKKKK